MDFLRCIPTVFVIGKRYEISVCTVSPGICSVDVGGKRYYPENSGVLSSESCCVKLRVPMAELDTAKKYTVFYRKTVERKAYFPKFEDEVGCELDFSPIPLDGGINIYHLADVHGRFSEALRTGSFFGDDVHLYILNGDMGEFEEQSDYYKILEFSGEISKGNIPVVMVRGNHDTRGRLAELYTDYFPSNGKSTYYTFELGRLFGVVTDCGEDKPDDHPEYGGANLFEPFRRKETEFLADIYPTEGRILFAVSHICPADTTQKKGSVFDIEDEVYCRWNRELERIGVWFMLSGHVHKAYYLPKNSKESLRDNPYHVIVGSGKNGDNIIGTALTLYYDRAEVRFTDGDGNIIKEFEITR